MANMEKPPKHRRNMPDWGNGPVCWQTTIVKGHWPVFPAETAKPPPQQPPMRRNPSLLSGENKPETPELFKAGVTDAVSHMGREAKFRLVQARRHCPKDLASPPVWHSTRSLTQLQHTKCILSQERHSTPILNWELLINSQCSLFTSALKGCFKTSDSS